MNPPPPFDRIASAYQIALAALLAERHPDGYWTGELSSSALSTATAVSALALVQKSTPPALPHENLIAGGLAWLAQQQNDDGGWGDTDRSFSNISTTMLCRAAFHLAGKTAAYAETLRRADAHLEDRYGKSAGEQAEAVRRRYGKDRTFSVPILTNCALAGLVSWEEVPPLPFELACFPQSWFRFLRLPVVSYALPALIAIGQAVYHHRQPRNPLTRAVRRLAVGKSLRVLEAIQPSNGGFLEATPLTSFVTMSLAGIGRADHAVARKGVEFLVNSVRPDGSWAIDTNLATWVTTLSVNALAAAGEMDCLEQKAELKAWLLQQQFKQQHPYSGAAPCAWGWTNLPGSVPDADDTAGALLALSAYSPAVSFKELAEGASPRNLSLLPMACAGVRWLLHLQNWNSGWPTFCRGWGHLPFDRSGPDLTAHAVRAIQKWLLRLEPYRCVLATLPKPTAEEYQNPCSHFWNPAYGPWLTRNVIGPSERAILFGLRYLQRHQRPDGSWLPLWFGNQHAPDEANPTYGTARVLAAYRDLAKMDSEPARRGVAWLLAAQNADGGWGGAAGAPPSVEETALAVEILLDAGPKAEMAVNKGLAWLVERVEAGGLNEPSPIGFYFAKLWYYEKLYPVIFTVAALGRALRKLSPLPCPASPEPTA